MKDYDLDTPILNLGDGVKWTARNAVEGVQIFGGIGSGKTSGSGETLAKKYLSQGYGGLVLTVKPNELEENWLPYCKETGREDDLIVIKPDGENTFNFVSYELNREGAGSGLVDNLVNTFKTVLKAGRNNNMSDGDFWEDALDMLLFNVLDLCYWAYDDKISIDKIFAVVNSLPKTEKEFKDDYQRLAQNKQTANKEKKKQSPSAFFRAFERLDKLVSHQMVLDKQRYEEEHGLSTYGSQYVKLKAWQDYAKLRYYFKNDFMPLAPKTKSIIEHMFKGLLFRLSREPVHSLLCSPSYNVTPEQSLDDKIIVFDLPVKDYDKIGKDAQILFKYVWQRAMERRRMTKHNRPVFLWADEAQNFIHDHDIDYQATARSSRVCTVYLTQNLPNYFAHMGGHNGEYRVKSFLGTMGTKIFHANADIETNDYASNLFGEGFYYDESTSHEMSGQFSSSQSRSISMKKNVRPEQFVSMKTGGDINDKRVQCYIHKQGTPWVWKKKINGEVEILSQNFKSLTFIQS